MNTLRKITLVTLLSCGFVGTANAADNLWLGLKAGTLGLGVEATWRPIDWLDLRLGANSYEYDDEGSQAGINYDGTFTLENYYATANFRFPLSPFRLTAGAYSNANEIALMSVDPPPIMNIGGVPFPSTGVGTLTSLTSWDDVSPYIGAGFDFELLGKLGMSFDFGVLYQGDPIVVLGSDGPLMTDPSPVGQLYRAALEQERLDLVDEADALKLYPVVSLGITFNFF
jgi:hypothetical protein